MDASAHSHHSCLSCRLRKASAIEIDCPSSSAPQFVGRDGKFRNDFSAFWAIRESSGNFGRFLWNLGDVGRFGPVESGFEQFWAAFFEIFREILGRTSGSWHYVFLGHSIGIFHPLADLPDCPNTLHRGAGAVVARSDVRVHDCRVLHGAYEGVSKSVPPGGGGALVAAVAIHTLPCAFVDFPPTFWWGQVRQKSRIFQIIMRRMRLALFSCT